jgi:hypothetical protein
MHAFDFTREYEEDLRPYFLPARGQEDRVTTALTVTGLSKEWKDSPANVMKYLYKVLTVSGRIVPTSKEKGDKNVGVLVLESNETDQPLRVVCRFGREAASRLELAKELRIRGLFTTLKDGPAMVLEDCEDADISIRTVVPRLTEDYFPHKVGNTLTYDIATFQVKKRTSVRREVWYQQAGGITETVVTHAGSLTGKTLFGEKPEVWITAPRTKKTKLPGAVYVRTLTGAAVLFGQRISIPRKGVMLTQEPILKLGAKAGETWQFIDKTVKHVYTLERFDKYRGQPCAIIKEVIVTPENEVQAREIYHTYVEHRGEVERREWLRITTTVRIPVQEMKMILVEDIPVGPVKDAGGKKPEEKKPSEDSPTAKDAKDK